MAQRGVIAVGDGPAATVIIKYVGSNTDIGSMVNWYLVKRLGQSFLVFLIGVTITFVLYRLMPGNPAEVMRSQLIAQAVEQGGALSDRELRRINKQVELRTNINPELPIWQAYINYMGDVLRLDFGESIRHSEPVFQLLFKRMPWSIFLSIYSLALGTTAALILGAAMAHLEATKFDVGLSVFSIVNTTIPYYITAIVLIIIFAIHLGWFPNIGRYDETLEPGFNIPFMLSVMHHGTLPILSGFFASFAGSLGFRANCIREKGKEYIRLARFRGIQESRIAIRYVGRNALLPIYTGIMLGLSGLFGSSIILEIIFNYRAVGLTTFGALKNRDYPLLMGAFIFYTTITLIGIFIADVTYSIIDPRVKTGDERESF